MTRWLFLGLTLAALLASPERPADRTPHECPPLAACASPWNGTPQNP